MNNCIARPWDKADKRKRGSSSNIRSSASVKIANQNDVAAHGKEAPFVEIENERFYSDRFYLNRTLYDDNTDTRNSYKTCTCGAKQAPPLIDLCRLVHSLDIEVAILGTFSFDVKYLQKRFPKLFSPNATIPTLVLHGKKGSTIEGFLSEDKEKSSNQQYDCDNDKPRSEPSVPTTLFFSEIKPMWVVPNTKDSWESSFGSRKECANKNDDNNVGIYRQGVHHPKFMIFLEKCGSIVVVVSTSNLTCPTSTDATWLQRFPARKPLSSNEDKATYSSDVGMQSDFGLVLSNFLQYESLATQPGQMTIASFVKTHCNWKSLNDLHRKYDFADSRVYLVPIVPGDYEGYQLQRKKLRLCPKKRSRIETQSSDNNPIFTYGRQRINFVLDRVSSGPDRSIPSALISPCDRLIIQPTSFGSDWNRHTLSNVIRSYFCYGRENDENDSTYSVIPTSKSAHHENSLLTNLEILWPTENFIRHCTTDSASPSQIHQKDGRERADTRQITSPNLERMNEGNLFLSSVSFNSIDLACLSQMMMYDPSFPSQQKHTLVPHIKSVCRLFEGNDFRLRKDFSISTKAEEYVSWFLLTSACLSRGAQGIDTIGKAPGSDSVSYANFELGVLFTSQLYPDRFGGHLYCWKPSRCLCGVKAPRKTNRVIHLPIPYCLRPKPFQENQDEPTFCDTPYFHEILPGTGGLGNMRLTPLGLENAQHYEKNAVNN